MKKKKSINPYNHKLKVIFYFSRLIIPPPHHTGLPSYANFSKLNMLTIFQLLMCGADAAITRVVCTSGLEIEFYPHLTPE